MRVRECGDFIILYDINCIYFTEMMKRKAGKMESGKEAKRPKVAEPVVREVLKRGPRGKFYWSYNKLTNKVLNVDGLPPVLEQLSFEQVCSGVEAVWDNIDPDSVINEELGDGTISEAVFSKIDSMYNTAQHGSRMGYNIGVEWALRALALTGRCDQAKGCQTCSSIHDNMLWLLRVVEGSLVKKYFPNVKLLGRAMVVKGEAVKWRGSEMDVTCHDDVMYGKLTRCITQIMKGCSLVNHNVLVICDSMEIGEISPVMEAAYEENMMKSYVPNLDGNWSCESYEVAKNSPGQEAMMELQYDHIDYYLARDVVGDATMIDEVQVISEDEEEAESSEDEGPDPEPVPVMKKTSKAEGGMSSAFVKRMERMKAILKPVVPDTEYDETRKLKDLKVNKIYAINYYRVVKGEYGDCVIMQLVEGVKTFDCWANAHLTKIVKESSIPGQGKGVFKSQMFYLIYQGEVTMKNGNKFFKTKLGNVIDDLMNKELSEVNDMFTASNQSLDRLTA